MFDHKIDTFLAVVESGSFNKAAEKLFISPTAVMKQMNNLESQLNLNLIKRSPSGVIITPSGESLYRDLVKIKEDTKRAIDAARIIENSNKKVIRVGTSILNPCSAFIDLWSRMCHCMLDFQLEIIPFDDDHNDILSVIENLGTEFDFIIGVCNSRRWFDRCDLYRLGKYKKMVAVPMDHPLACKSILRLEDLYGEKLIMVKEGDSPLNDYLRHDLNTNHPEIIIEDADYFYDINVFNRCLKENCALLSLECWKNVHPSLVTIPVEWDYSIDYGLLYSFNPSENVTMFINELKKSGI